jgi:uncharacterized protein
MLKIPFSEISEEGLSVHFEDKSFIPEEVYCSGPVSADVVLERKDSRVILSGEFKVVVELSCDRCLEKFNNLLENTFTVDFELVGEGENNVEDIDYHCQESELDTIVLDKPEIDVVQVVSQQVLLAMPMKKICSQDCKGLCEKCGANLNNEQEKCTCEKEVHSPFNILAQLKKNN